MARNTKSFRLWQRKERGNVYFMRLPGGAWESTGCTDRKNAEARAIQRLGVIEHAAVSGKVAERKVPDGGLTLREYAKDFFRCEPGKPPSCPWCIMKLPEGKQIGPEHAKRQRRLLDRFILKDPITDLPFRTIRKGQIMDFRSRVLAKCGADVSDEANSKGKRTASLALPALSVIFFLAVSRDEIEANPVSRITVQSKSAARGTLTLAELRRLLPYNPANLGPWRDLQAKTAFILAGTCGLRRNEVWALRWERVDLPGAKLTIDEAFKGNARRSKPKWNKKREMALPHVAADHLQALGPDERLVFHHADGSPLGMQWWEGAFNHAMEKLNIDAKARRIVPHSLRHSLASELRAAGVSDALLQNTFGWRDASTTDRYAGHLTAERA